ncbi:aminoglycoside phosphotransferase family protein [Pseudolysinimonas sp.]|uniref:aminoglycoside phosphotransferase family protein n=1 Tax=Pseudolysinimonas sp. TaxID=2680009 RepID=UPI003F800142
MPAPPSEVDITPELVAALLRTQHPDFAGEVRFVAHGWDNDIYRVGDRLAVRMPRRELAVPLVANEQRWLAELAPHLTVPVPVAVAAGAPGAGYPWPWSVLPWFDGDPADRLTPVERRALAEPLAEALLSLHRPAPPDAPVNPYRGVPLGQRDASVRERIAALDDDSRGAALQEWETASAAAPNAVPVWVHGDLHPGNVLVGPDREIAAIIDFGDMSGGDPAVDLAAAWLFFDPVGRDAFRARIDRTGRDAALWRRARGWALAFALGLLHESDGSDRMVGLGRFGLRELLGDSATS